MWIFTTILTITFCAYSLDNSSFDRNQYLHKGEPTHCKTVIDSLTKKIIYITVDKEAVNDGGQIALLRQYEKIKLDSIPDDMDTRFIVAFIVDTEGHITGERIIKDKVGNVGQQMIKIVKSLKWSPAECDGRKVPVLVTLSPQMCLREN